MRRHSFLSPKCIAKHSNIHNAGVFAIQDIKKDELIAIWGGYVMTDEEFDRLPKEIYDYSYPVGVYGGYYLGPKSVDDLDDAEMFNHSCEPNAGVKGQIALLARRDIKAGEEVCFDYETTDTRGDSFDCNCRSKICRKKIDYTSWQNFKFQKANQGYFSWYIQELINKKISA